MQRRKFITTTLATTAALSMSGCRIEKQEDTQNTNAPFRGKKTKLKLATSWPAQFPIMGTGVEAFAKRCYELSGGSLEIEVYSKDTLVPALQVFDAASAGQIDAFHSGVYYWKGKDSAFSIFGGVPFGLTSEEMITWLKFGGGYELWRELYGKFNLYPIIGGTTGPQMGGWFKKEINTLDDLKGLKMRMPGLAGEVMQLLGVTPVLLPAAEIYTALERGVIDASEWVGPYLDEMMGFSKIAPYYYTGWHEPGSILEITFNLDSWNKLTPQHQAIITTASEELTATMLQEFRYKNAKAFQTLQKEVHIRLFSQEIMQAAKEALGIVLAEEEKKSANFAKVLKSHNDFMELNRDWDTISTKHFLSIRD